MATITSIHIPFSVQVDGQQVDGKAIGEHLTDYAVFEIRLDNGEIFQMEAIPGLERYQWFGLRHPEYLSAIGKAIEDHFKYSKDVSAHAH